MQRVFCNIGCPPKHVSNSNDANIHFISCSIICIFFYLWADRQTELRNFYWRKSKWADTCRWHQVQNILQNISGGHMAYSVSMNDRQITSWRYIDQIRNEKFEMSKQTPISVLLQIWETECKMTRIKMVKTWDILTHRVYSTIKDMAWISHYIHAKEWDAIPHPCHNFSGLVNSLRPSDAYMRRWTGHHCFR